MPNYLTAPGAALALALTFVFTAGSVGVLRTRHHPDQCARMCAVVIVLVLSMAASVVIFHPLQAGDLIEEREQR